MLSRVLLVMLAGTLLFGGNVFAQAPDDSVFPEFLFKESDFASLKQAILERKKWEVPLHIDKSQASIISRVFSEHNEIRGFALKLIRGIFVFSRKADSPSAKISEYSFNYENRTDLLASRALVEWSRVPHMSRVPEVRFNHSHPGTGVPTGGYVTNANLNSQIRLFVNSEEDSQQVLFFPVQRNNFTVGFMFCPRTLSKLGNSAAGRFLEPNDFELTDLRGELEAEILAKLMEGFGPGVTVTNIRIESSPQSLSTNFAIRDYNQGYFPEAAVVLPDYKSKTEMPFVPDQLNQLGVRVDVALTDSGSNQLLLSFKSSLGVLPFNLTSSEPLTHGEAKLTMRPGQCYLAMQRLWFSSKRIAGDKPINLPN